MQKSDTTRTPGLPIRPLRQSIDPTARTYPWLDRHFGQSLTGTSTRPQSAEVGA